MIAAILGGACLVLALFPLLLALANLPLFRRPPLARDVPSVSVLIPARNEAANIDAAAAHVLASTGVDLELLVLDDGSTDATPDILRAIGDPRLRVLQGGMLPRGWSGKQHACARLAEQARHPLMVFLDADVRLAPDALARMAGFMQADPALGLASGFPRQVTRGWSERLLLPLIHLLLLGYLPFPLAQRRGDPALGAGCGQLFIARREAYGRAGGHAAIRASLHDGLTLPRAFRQAGQMTGLFDATDLASVRMYSSAGALWEGLTKNATEGMAKPGTLPVWTVLLGGGHVLPALLMLVAPSPAAWAALGCSYGLRLLLTLRFRQSLLGALLHPLGVAGVLVVQYAALLRALRGRPNSWRGRLYDAP